MRICILTTSYPRFPDDEAGIFVGRLVQAFSDAKAEGLVFVPYDREEVVEETAGRFKVQRFKYGIFSAGGLAFGSGIIPHLRTNPLLVFQIPLLLARFVIAAVRDGRTCDLIQANWIGAGSAAWLASLISGQAYVVTIRGEDVRILQNKFLTWLFHMVLGKAAAVVSVNDSFLKLLRKLYKLEEKKLVCIPNGVNREVVNPEYYGNFLAEKKLKSNNNYLLFVGTITPRKRIEVLIKLIGRPKMADYQLILCGRTADGVYLEDLRKQAAAYGCTERVHFQGAVPPREIPYYLKLCRFYLSASEFEGRPNSVLEALAAGRIVLLSDIEAHRELIEDRTTGILFSVDNLGSLEESIKMLEDNPEIKETITGNAQALISEYSWEKTAKRYLELFEKILEK